MKRIEYLVGLLDSPRQKVVFQFVPIRHAEAPAIAGQLSQLLAGRDKARGSAGAVGGVSVVVNERTNQLVLVGMAGEVADAAGMVESLDVALGLITRTYVLKVASPQQVDRLIKDLLGETDAMRLYKSATDPDANLLVATTTAEVHARISALVETLDKPRADSQSPIRFYKLRNAKAAEVLTTLEGIEGDHGMDDVSLDGDSAHGFAPAGDAALPIADRAAGIDPATGASADRPARQRGRSVRLGGARVMADEATNSIIVVAKPSMQSVYEGLIEKLDVRRPQVSIEATVVTVDTTDDFSLGVEISYPGSARDGKDKILNFSNFGLSEVNASTGMLSLKPGLGFNGALLSADIANVVIHALESDSRAKVVSRPNILINDNATGTLASESEEPYASVNASSTVATTSYGGNSKAGTMISVTPQISEGDYLKLQYEIELSSFGEDRTDVLPPSKHTDRLKSEATIPNGYTIVVGGLSRENLSQVADRVPGLGRLPLLEHLFSARTNDKKRTTLFVFIHAVILRDDKFEDLKLLSGGAAGLAELSDESPRSEAVEIR